MRKTGGEMKKKMSKYHVYEGKISGEEASFSVYTHPERHSVSVEMPVEVFLDVDKARLELARQLGIVIGDYTKGEWVTKIQNIASGEDEDI